MIDKHGHKTCTLLNRRSTLLNKNRSHRGASTAFPHHSEHNFKGLGIGGILRHRENTFIGRDKSALNKHKFDFFQRNVKKNHIMSKCLSLCNLSIPTCIFGRYYLSDSAHLCIRNILLPHFRRKSKKIRKLGKHPHHNSIQ